MNRIDFSHPGGFPLTQDELDYLQQAYISCVQALGAAGVNGATPTILNGMVVSGGGDTVSNGWFIYGDELIQFTGGTVAPLAGEVALVLITDNTTSLTYNDTSVFPAHHSKTATLTHGVSLTDATHFPVSALVPWVIIDPTLYNDIAYINSQLAFINSSWSIDSWVASVFGGTGSITGGTVVYNKYKWIGHTYVWQAQVNGCTITGTPSIIQIHAPGVYLAGGSWNNLNGKLMTSTADFGGTLFSLITVLTLSGIGGMVINCNINGTPWSAATSVNFNINLIAEV